MSATPRTDLITENKLGLGYCLLVCKDLEEELNEAKKQRDQWRDVARGLAKWIDNKHNLHLYDTRPEEIVLFEALEKI